jgi:hypothetical protein
MRTALALLALVLVSCGGGGKAVDDGPAEVARILLTAPVAPEWDGLLGVTWRTAGGTTVHVRADLDPRIVPWWSVIAHELFHVAGFREHLDAPCTSSADALSPLQPGVAGPCEAELALMADVPGPIRLVVEGDDDVLRGHTLVAAAWWNASLGRELFQVVD